MDLLHGACVYQRGSTAERIVILDIEYLIDENYITSLQIITG
jgi:hypothetical protein